MNNSVVIRGFTSTTFFFNKCVCEIIEILHSQPFIFLQSFKKGDHQSIIFHEVFRFHILVTCFQFEDHSTLNFTSLFKWLSIYMIKNKKERHQPKAFSLRLL
ncbi:hypothetical protein L1987_71673 [Smallanthus sonchifolius]|uniref:Uncharacterized protein n=1 Tax=Smallanthus sonchifolius TaxID=185202 RepID=A0ACB9ASH7_9ASTR|nr:hypothetical protein L1987_71673 [Smallanthus sonchifolius]